MVGDAPITCAFPLTPGCHGMRKGGEGVMDGALYGPTTPLSYGAELSLCSH